MAKRKKNEPNSPSSQGLALTYLRTAAGWTKKRLARALGYADEAPISSFERGRPLSREKVISLVEPLGHPPEAVDVLRFAHGVLFPVPEEDRSPVPLIPEERRIVERAVMAAAWTAGQIAADETRAELIRRIQQQKVSAAKQEAARLFQGLMALTPKERRGLVEAAPEYWSWALAVLLCEESVRKAAHKAGEALELAGLAQAVAERSPGEESWRSRLKGYCWAHVANARRVANDLRGANQAFARAWELWRAGADTGLLAEWVLPSLEASLRREERRFPEALDLLDQAKAAPGGSSATALAALLLKEEFVLEQMGDLQGALAALAEASPLVEALGDARKLFALRFKTANNLCYLARFSEAARILPQVRELAEQQRNELDLIRVSWLAARIAAGQRRTEEAAIGFEQVRREFAARGMAYDAALSSLDLAVLRLEEGRMAEVRELAVALGRIFERKRIHREALASLKLFCEAARKEAATVDLARRVIAEIEQARRPASSRTGKGRG